MSPVQMLLGCLLLLYLSEFLVWVRPDVWLFRRRGRGWEALTQGGLLCSSRGSLHWVYPMPQLGRAYSVRWSIPATPSMGSITDRPSVDASFSVRDIERRLQSVESALQPLRWTSWGLWALICLVCPLLLLWVGLVPMLGLLLAGALILMTTNAWILARIHGRLFFESGDERLRLVLSACLSPLAAIRSWDLSQKQALEGFHPLAVAAALPNFRDWENLAAAEWRRLRYPVLPPLSVGGMSVADEPGSAEVRAAIEALARQRGIEPAFWDSPPKATDPAHTQYCPRCRAQFTWQANTCHDCRRTTLSPIPQ